MDSGPPLASVLRAGRVHVTHGHTRLPFCAQTPSVRAKAWCDKRLHHGILHSPILTGTAQEGTPGQRKGEAQSCVPSPRAGYEAPGRPHLPAASAVPEHTGVRGLRGLGLPGQRALATSLC